MEISNNVASHFAALSGKNAGNAKASAAQLAAHAPASNANVAATLKAGNSSFTPTEAVQKEAEKWESFAADTLSEMKSEMDHHNHIKNIPDSYWSKLEEAGGSEFVAIRKQQEKEEMARIEATLVTIQQSLVDHDFNVSGTLYQKNNVGDFEFGDFELSKQGLGYELLFDGPETSEISYSRSRGRGNKPDMNNDLQALLFREEHR